MGDECLERQGEQVRLRAITYLSPGVPFVLFEKATEVISNALGVDISIDSDPSCSGPMCAAQDVFLAGKADIGFVCSPSFLSRRTERGGSLILVPAAFVFDDPRNPDNEPVYFSNVMVRSDHRAESFEDLRGSHWGYNDESSLSGHFCALQALSALQQQLHGDERKARADKGTEGGHGGFERDNRDEYRRDSSPRDVRETHGHGSSGDLYRSYFSDVTRTGSHKSSISLLLAGDIDAAAIDAAVLRDLASSDPAALEKLRSVASWGPFPVQPVVVRAGISRALRGSPMPMRQDSLDCDMPMRQDIPDCDMPMRQDIPDCDKGAGAEEGQGVGMGRDGGVGVGEGDGMGMGSEGGGKVGRDGGDRERGDGEDEVHGSLSDDEEIARRIADALLAMEAIPEVGCKGCAPIGMDAFRDELTALEQIGSWDEKN